MHIKLSIAAQLITLFLTVQLSITEYLFICSHTGIQRGIYENCTIITNEDGGVSIPFEEVPAGIFNPVQVVCSAGLW